MVFNYGSLNKEFLFLKVCKNILLRLIFDFLNTKYFTLFFLIVLFDFQNNESSLIIMNINSS